MAKKKNTSKKDSYADDVAIGVGLTTAAVTAGAYFLYGSKSF